MCQAQTGSDLNENGQINLENIELESVFSNFVPEIAKKTALLDTLSTVYWKRYAKYCHFGF